MYLANALVFLLLGAAEAVFWHKTVNKWSRIKLKRMHYPLVVIRIGWFIAAYYIMDKDAGSVIPLIIMHSFFHLGALYQVRHWLNERIYEYGFFDNGSKTSTALWDALFPLTIEIRILLLIVGTAFYIIWNYWV